MTNKIKVVISTGIILTITIIATILHNSKSPGYTPAGTSDNIKSHSVSVKVFQVDDKGWGYEIFIDSSRFIYQDVIPGISGIVRFKSKDDAFKCGKLVTDKLIKKKNPAISIKEIDSLGISVN
jgi:hypothetical protein